MVAHDSFICPGSQGALFIFLSTLFLPLLCLQRKVCPTIMILWVTHRQKWINFAHKEIVILSIQRDTLLLNQLSIWIYVHNWKIVRGLLCRLFLCYRHVFLQIYECQYVILTYVNTERKSERKITTFRYPYFNSIVADIKYTVDIPGNLKNKKTQDIFELHK